MSLPLVRILVDRVIGALVVLCEMLAAIPVLVLFLFVIIKRLSGILRRCFLPSHPIRRACRVAGCSTPSSARSRSAHGLAAGSARGALIGVFLSENGATQVGDTVRFISERPDRPTVRIAFGHLPATRWGVDHASFLGALGFDRPGGDMLPVSFGRRDGPLLVPRRLREPDWPGAASAGA